METVPPKMAITVVRRAAHRCEYCGLSQDGQEARFHIDHAIPRAAGGKTLLDNLALACVSCSLRKGARETATDPTTGREAAIFNPRRDVWARHFRWEGLRMVGTTPTGRATVAALHMNRQLILAIREEESWRGRFPPPSEWLQRPD
jgi:hypothetical protein